MQLKTKSKTYSIWKLFQMKEFTNPLYEGTFFDSKYNGLFFAGDTTLKMTGNSAPIPQPAWPLGPCDLWRDYWCRYQNNKNTKSTSQLEIQAVQDCFHSCLEGSNFICDQIENQNKQLVSRNQELREKMQQLANQRR